MPLPIDGHEPLAAGPGRKWDIHGNAQRFTGNTFVSPIPRNSAFFHAQIKAQDRLRASAFSRHYVLTPYNSFHMTVLDGVNQDQLGTADWPTWMAHATSTVDTNIPFLRRLESARLDVPRTVTMRADGLRDMATGFIVALAPIDIATAEALNRFRDQVTELLGLSRTGFGTYRFHSTMGYRLVEPLPSEHEELHALQNEITEYFAGDAGTVTVDPLAFNIFDDMLAFPQLTVL
ncbi:DUF1868 domain-containing protein [Nocardia sp. NPDC023852]|uniref:DUF1868 domain-containing protein n=1 Tax=Nocardia sp. NPDC023852 TaxID=3154697 RepID=UPI0033F2B8D6